MSSGTSVNTPIIPAPPPPEPPSEKIRWKKHTMGGLCIYCGEPAITASHLDACQKSPPGTKDGHASVPGMTATGGKRRASTATITPPPPQQQHPSAAKKPRSTLHPGGVPDEYSFQCLTPSCRRKNCPYDGGYTVFSDLGGTDDQEHDPSEPCHRSWKKKHSCYDAWTFFHEVKIPIELSIAGVVQSKDFWANHKYLGSTSLDRKVQAWMKIRIKPPLVDKYWIFLRKAVKEAIRFKRQECIEFVRSTFYGESALFALFSLIIALVLPPTNTYLILRFKKAWKN